MYNPVFQLRVARAAFIFVNAVLLYTVQTSPFAILLQKQLPYVKIE